MTGEWWMWTEIINSASHVPPIQSDFIVAVSIGLLWLLWVGTGDGWRVFPTPQYPTLLHRAIVKGLANDLTGGLMVSHDTLRTAMGPCWPGPMAVRRMRCSKAWSCLPRMGGTRSQISSVITDRIRTGSRRSPLSASICHQNESQGMTSKSRCATWA